MYKKLMCINRKHYEKGGLVGVVPQQHVHQHVSMGFYDLLLQTVKAK
jgi:hypothetical protein